MSQLIINSLILQRIAEHGLNEEKTIQQINTILQTIPQEEKDVNFVEFGGSRDGSCFVWLTNYDKETNKYFYLCEKYHEHKAWTIKRYNEKPQKLLKILIAAKTQNADFKKSQKPKDGYFIKELKNNKPLTLLAAKDKNFVCFVAFKWFFSDGSPRINEIDIDEYKETYKNNFFGFGGAWDANTARKEAESVYAVYNKQMPQYLDQKKKANEKRLQRANNRPNKQYKKYFYTDESVFNDLLSYKNDLHFYNGFSHNSLLKHEFDTVSTGSYIRYKGKDYPKTTEPMTRQQFFDMVVDKSGYFVLDYRYNLEQRADQLKKEREQERREKARQEWNNLNHAPQVAEINKYLMQLHIEISNRSTFENLLQLDTWEELKQLRELYLQFAYYLEFSRFSSLISWNEKLQEQKEKYLFFMRAINKKVLNKIACFHHYEKQADGSYKNISKDSFFNDASRYIQEF